MKMDLNEAVPENRRILAIESPGKKKGDASRISVSGFRDPPPDEPNTPPR